MDIKTVASVIESFTKTAAIILGAIWAYWKFVRQRTHEPASDMDIEVEFVGLQDDKWIIEVTAVLKNIGQVQLRYQHFFVKVRYLTGEDRIEDSPIDKLKFQLHCPRSINERVGGKDRAFDNASWIDPKQEFKHRYVTFIPAEATFLWVQTSFIRLHGRKEKSNSQRIFLVPREEPGGGSEPGQIGI
jgi:hypothetical protein